MEPKESVQINGRIVCAPSWLRDRNRRTQAVVIRLTKWNNNVESVGGAALKQNNGLLFSCGRWRGRNCALQESGHRAKTNHRDAALLQEISPRKFQLPHALATSIAHASLQKLPKLAALKFRRAQHQTRHHTQVHVPYRIVQSRVHNFRAVEL